MVLHIISPSAQLDLTHPDKWELFIENFYLKQFYHHMKRVDRDQDLPTLQTAIFMIPNIPPVLY